MTEATATIRRNVTVGIKVTHKDSEERLKKWATTQWWLEGLRLLSPPSYLVLAKCARTPTLSAENSCHLVTECHAVNEYHLGIKVEAVDAAPAKCLADFTTWAGS